MKKLLFSIFSLLAVLSNAQNILYSETFNSNLGTCTASNSSNGAWVWSNSCAQSSLTGHSGPGHAIFQGSGCTFGNGANTTSGSLVTPTIAIGALGGLVTFNYFLSNECTFGNCNYDVLSFEISNNNGQSYNSIVASSAATSSIVNTASSGWASVSYNLATYTNQTIMIRFNFNSVDGIGNNYDGIYVDDILVTGFCSITTSASNGTNNISPAVCTGNSIFLVTNAVSNYSWNTGATTSSIAVSPTVNTSYTLTATSVSNCVATSVINVTVSGSLPVLTVSSSTNNVCLGKTVTLTASGATSYSWSGGVTNGVGFVPTTTSNYTLSGQNGCGTTTAVTGVTVAPLQVSLLVSPTVVCSGNQANISVIAAANNYTILPLNAVGNSSNISVSPQFNAFYTVSASDGTCIGVSTISLAVVPIPTITAILSNSQVCAGDPVVITASGGLNYSWTPGNLSGATVTVNPLNPTAYVVTGNNSFGCLAGTSAVVITNSVPIMTVTANTNLICSGETVTLTSTGATSYVWSGGSTTVTAIEMPTSTTVYSVIGTSNGCSNTETVQISVFIPSVTISGSTSICMGNALNLTASGAQTYTWEPGNVLSAAVSSTPSTSFTYTLSTLTTNGSINCPSTQTIQISLKSNPTVLAVAASTAICRNESTTITASGASTYVWSGASTVSGSSIVATSSLITTLIYNVTGTGPNGCKSDVGVLVKINSCNSLNEFNQKYGIKLYPNPNSGEFTLEAESEMQLIILNELGQLVKTLSLNAANNFKVKEFSLSNGIYFVTGQSNKQTIKEKIVVLK
jgi:hypothetical protein